MIIGFAALTAVIVPIGVVLLTSASAPSTGFIGHFTDSNFVTVLTSHSSLGALGNTAVLTLGGAAIAVTVGSLLAWIVTNTNVPFKRVLRVLLLSPLLLPPLMKDTAWIQLYSARTGLVNLAAEHVFGLKHALFNIYGLKGMIVSEGFALAPIAYLMIVGAMQSLNPALDEASRLCGAGTRKTMRRIVIPILSPAILSAFALVALIVAGSFETPILIGAPAGVETYMSVIYHSLSGSSIPNFNLAAAQADVYFVFNGLLLTWYVAMTRREHKFFTVAGKGQRRRGTGGRRNWLLLIFPLVYFWLAFGQLFVQGILVSLVPFYTVTAGFPFRSLSMSNYTELFKDPLTSAALRDSLKISLAVTAITVVAATVLAIAAFQSRLRGRRWMEVIGTLPIAIPRMVFSVALLITVLTVPGLRQAYGTVLPLIVVEVVIFLPYALRTISASLLQLPPALREAAASSGAGLWKRTVSVSLPLIRVALVNAALIVFVLSFRELAGVVLLTAANTPLVPTVALADWFNGLAGQVEALNVVMVALPAVVAGAFIGMLKLVGVWRGRRAALMVDRVADVALDARA